MTLYLKDILSALGTLVFIACGMIIGGLLS